MRDRVLRELQRQPRSFPWLMLISASCTFVALLRGGRNPGFLGPVVHYVVLCGSGALVVLSIVLLVMRRRHQVRPPRR